jgi:hypothetical protein
VLGYSSVQLEFVLGALSCILKEVLLVGGCSASRELGRIEMIPAEFAWQLFSPSNTIFKPFVC